MPPLGLLVTEGDTFLVAKVGALTGLIVVEKLLTMEPLTSPVCSD